MTEIVDTPFVTGETFEQLQAKDVYVTPTGGARQTLADALSFTAGGTVNEVVVVAGPFLQGADIITTGTVISSINPTNHGVLIGQGASAIAATAAMTNGQVLVGQTAANPLPKTISGDLTINSAGAAALAATGVAAGTYGDSSHIVQIDVDAAGRILTATSVAVIGGGNVSSSGTPAAGQVAQWTSATAITGVDLSSAIAAADLSGLPTSNPGGGKVWLNGGFLFVGAI